MKLWAGRFKKETDKKVNDFNSSLRFDCRMFSQDIDGSIAHATMLGKQGIISSDEKDLLVAELAKLKSEIDSGKQPLSQDSEDIHMNIEELLTERLGSTGKRLHTSRSRNDQVALDLRLYMRDELASIRALTVALIKTLTELAEKHTKTVMPGYTHLQRAQPITLAHHLMAYAQMFLRDIGRLDDCRERMDEMPLGSCALAATTYDIDRDYTRELLGFKRITENSLDGVSDRDYALEIMFCISVIMMHLSRFSEEIILWCSGEFSFIELDDAYATGSSIMPQKKNPDIAELVRGKTGRAYGNLMALLTVMKGIPLAYNKDMQEDKEAIFDSVDTVKMCLEVFAPMISTMTVNKASMLKAASGGFINATDCADYLVRKGIPFRDAYKITGQLVAVCIEKGVDLGDLPLSEYKKFTKLFSEDIYDSINLINCVNKRTVIGGPAETEVLRQIQAVKNKLSSISIR